MLRLIVGFLPWIIFGALGNSLPSLALILALAISTVAVARQLMSRSFKILDVVTFAFFVFIAVGLIGFGWTILAAYMTLLVNLVLMAVAWGSLIVGAPFTIQYAREQTPPEVWKTPLFLHINQAITAVWGLSFFLSVMISLYRHATGDDSFFTRYAWILLSAAALAFTLYFPDWYRARALRASAPSAGAR
jgi:uncharacterized membrane protein